jgi:hypothetical protein
VFLFYVYVWLISAILDAYCFISTVMLNGHASNMETDVEALLTVIQGDQKVSVHLMITIQKVLGSI